MRNAGSLTLEEGSFTTQDDGKSEQGGWASNTTLLLVSVLLPS